jgi:hypothetical protein
VASNLTINYTINATLTAIRDSNPDEYNTLIAAANAADTYYMTNFTALTPVTLTYDLNLNSSGVANSSAQYIHYTYNEVYQAVQLVDNAATANATMKAAAAAMPVVDMTYPVNATDPAGAPVAIRDMEMPTFWAMAVGLTDSSNGNKININKNLVWGVPANGVLAKDANGDDANDAVSTMEHEIAELMGRAASAGYDSAGSYPGETSANLYGTYNLLDFFRYTAAGTRAEPFVDGYHESTATYFAVNAAGVGTAQSKAMEDYPKWMPPGTGVVGAHNADVADWSGTLVDGDPFGSSAAGTVDTFSEADTALMNVLGYQSLACFLPDTRIATPSGLVAVQDLEVGDLVTTLHGEEMPIIWIGTGQALATRGRRTAATPVIVRKSALGPNVPAFDLRITKGHALFY